MEPPQVRTLVGNPNVPLVWTVSPTDVEDEFLLVCVLNWPHHITQFVVQLTALVGFRIVMVDSPIAWTLADGDDGTPVSVYYFLNPRCEAALCLQLSCVHRDT